MTRVFFLLLVSIAFSGAAQAADVLFNDGGTHVENDATNAANDLYVRNVGCPVGLIGEDPCGGVPGAPTTLLVQPGALILDIRALDTSIVEVTGGSVAGDLRALGQSEVSVFGGGPFGDVSAAGPSSTPSNGTMNISGGSGFTKALATGHNSVLNISGGSDFTEVIATGNDTTVNITGGQNFAQLLVTGNDTTMNVSGGEGFDAVRVTGAGTVLNLTGGEGFNSLETTNGVANITGVGFELDGVPVEGVLCVGSGITGTLTGRLQSGDDLSVALDCGTNQGTVNLISAPRVPSGSALTWLLLAGALLMGLWFLPRAANASGRP